jgi:hypothetical protein
MIEYAQIVHETYAISIIVGVLLGLLSAMIRYWFI